MVPWLTGAVLGIVAFTAEAGANEFDWVGKIALDAEGLRSDDATQRASAVHLLALDSIEWSEPYLLRALTDDDRSVRLEAGIALGVGRSVAAIPTLIDWLIDSDAKTRAIAADALGDIGGPRATQALTRSLGDSDPAVRQRTVRALGKIGTRGHREVVAALLPRLDDEKAEVRREAIEQLEQLGDRRAVIPIVSRFADTSREVAKAAARAAGKLGDRSAVHALIRIIGDSDETLRRVAVQSLGQLGATEAIDALVQQLRLEGTDAYLGSVAYALGTIARRQDAGQAGQDALLALAQSLSNQRMRAAAVEGLRAAGPRAVPSLVAQLSRRGHTGTSAVSSAIALLSEVGDAGATDALIAELERGRVTAPLVLKALGATRDPRALIPVLTSVSSPEEETRVAAMRALHSLLGDDARAGDVLIERLGDTSLDVRILAAEYLGTLHVASAIPVLTSLVGADHPTSLRIAAITAIGEIASRPSAGAPNASQPRHPRADRSVSTTLVNVLRVGPAELHAAASTALCHIADSAILPNLIALAKADRGPTRHEVVRAIGGVLRSHPDPSARRVLRELASDGNAKVAVAAVSGLAAASNPNDAPFLRALAETASGERQAAAMWALGELHDVGSIDLLVRALSQPNDRLVGAAAWALGEIAAGARDGKSKIPPSVVEERLLHVAHRGGWSSSINAAAALGRALWAQPPGARAVPPAQQRSLAKLVHHRSRLVRLNAARALSSLAGDAVATEALTHLLGNDASPWVRIAAAEGLGRLGNDAGRAALEASAQADGDVRVATAAKAALTRAPAILPPRSEWRTFYVVDANGERVPNAPYFIHGTDGIAWASYTDSRGELTAEHVAPGTAAASVWPASLEPEF
jgi:HEAT repeat protein